MANAITVIFHSFIVARKTMAYLIVVIKFHNGQG